MRLIALRSQEQDKGTDSSFQLMSGKQPLLSLWWGGLALPKWLRLDGSEKDPFLPRPYPTTKVTIPPSPIIIADRAF